jgi:hypothetical protein
MNTREANVWSTCPPGEWQRLSAGLLFHKWIMLLRDAAIVLLAIFALAGGTWVAASQLSDNTGAPQQTLPCHPGPSCDAEQSGCDTAPESSKKN